MSEADEYRDNLYSPLQSKVLTLIPVFTASLSVMGSSIIIYIILSDRKRKLRRVYHRLLLAYSLVDLVFSINLGLSALVVPRGAPGVWGARGSWGTCEASGFVTQFGQSTGLYGASVCLYYLLILRFRVRERTIAKRVEPFIHLFAFLFPLSFATLMLCLDMYNPTNIIIGWCFINVYPADCLRRDDVPCERGQNYALWFTMNNALFCVYFMIVLVSSVLAYLQVRKLELRTSSSWTVNSKSRHRLKETAIQAVLYIGAFLLTYGIFGGATLFGPPSATEENRHIYFPLTVIIKFFLPMQGFWNCVIYVRPRFSALKRRNRNMRFWQIVKQILAIGAAAQQRQHESHHLWEHSNNLHAGDSVVSECNNGFTRPASSHVGDTVTEWDDFTPEIETDNQAQEMRDSELYDDNDDLQHGSASQVFQMDIVLDISSSRDGSSQSDSSSQKETPTTSKDYQSAVEGTSTGE